MNISQDFEQMFRSTKTKAESFPVGHRYRKLFDLGNSKPADWWHSLRQCFRDYKVKLPRAVIKRLIENTSQLCYSIYICAYRRV